MGSKKSLFGSTLKLNTIIGGIGGTITSASELEIHLGLNSGDVSDFKLEGLDVHARIEVNYEIPINRYLNNLDITSFEDLENIVTALNTSCFYGTTNMNSFIGFGNVTVVGTSVFRLCGMTGTLSLPLWDGGLGSGMKSVFRESKFSVLDIPSCTRLWDGACQDMPNLTAVNHGGFTYISTYCFYNTPKLTDFDFTGVTYIESYGFWRAGRTSGFNLVADQVTFIESFAFYQSGMTTFSLLSLTGLQNDVFNLSALQGVLDLNVLAPLITTMGQNNFRQSSLNEFHSDSLLSMTSVANFRSTPLQVLNTPNCVQIGSSTGDNKNFFLTPINGIATVSSVVEFDGDIAYLAGRGWTINVV